MPSSSNEKSMTRTHNLPNSVSIPTINLASITSSTNVTATTSITPGTIDISEVLSCMDISITKTQKLPNNIPFPTINLTSVTITTYNPPSTIDINKVDKSMNVFGYHRRKNSNAFIESIIQILSCPISWKFTTAPYLAPGLCFNDKDHIEKWLDIKSTSPLTRQAMLKTSLVRGFKIKIVNIMKEHTISKDTLTNDVESKNKLVTKASDMPDSENLVANSNYIANIQILKRKVKVRRQRIHREEKKSANK